ncbi:MAG: hypothetical protein IJ453_02065 [Oscillospiraceae bacterium]|nr:hypothetical protein [Oscillospiraceae bacterium]
MTRYEETFIRFLQQRRISHTVQEEEFVRIVYRGMNLAQIPILVYFDQEKPQKVSLLGMQIARFNDDNFVVGLGECNDSSSRSDYVRFRLDNDLEVLAEYDMKIRDNTFCDEIMEMLSIMAAAIDREAPSLQKAMWE